LGFEGGEKNGKMMGRDVGGSISQTMAMFLLGEKKKASFTWHIH